MHRTWRSGGSMFWFPLLSVAAVFVVIKNQAGVDVDTSECGRLQCLVVSTLVCVSLPVANKESGRRRW